MAKATSPIPAGFHSLTPELLVSDPAKYSEFLRNAFDAEEISQLRGLEGKLLRVQMRVGDSILMVCADPGAEFGLPPLAQGRLPFQLNFYCPDADATWASAVAAGCEVAMPIADQFWGDRYGHLRDPFGFVWVIATRVEDLTPAEQKQRCARTLLAVIESFKRAAAPTP
jgi:uncharacterized glyoxalase superfamily protein PhnB